MPDMKNPLRIKNVWIHVIRSGRSLKFIVQAQAENFVGTVVYVCSTESGTVVAGYLS